MITDPEPNSGSPTPQRPQTLGEYRMRMSFNPSGNQLVESLKRRAADFIDLCELAKQNSGNPLALTIAQTEMETAAMYAVKGATTPKLAPSLPGTSA